MKNLANCKPSEFLKQTNRVRKSVETWLTDNEIMEIRKRIPNLPDDISPEARKEAFAAQARENIGTMLDNILEVHPEETLALLALCCFIEPEDVDNYPMSDYLNAFSEMIGNDAVVNFFTSLVKLGRMNI